jgi:hypothetical protein
MIDLCEGALVMGSAHYKPVYWFVFLVGLIGAAFGVMELRAEMAVFGLIVASTSGLILLRIRAEALGRLDGLDHLEARGRAMVGSLTAPRV